MIIKHKKKQIITVIISIILCVSTAMPVSVYAQEKNIETENVGVSNISPEAPLDNKIHLHGASRPSRVKNLSTSGQYNFKGAINNSEATLYTDYKFKGKTKYTFFVKNTGKSILTVKAKRLTHTYSSTSIKAGQSKIISFSNINASTEFYLTFKGSSFSGYIK